LGQELCLTGMVGLATSLVLQQQVSQILHVLHTQPSSRTF